MFKPNVTNHTETVRMDEKASQEDTGRPVQRSPHRDDPETSAIRARLRRSQRELDRLRQAIDEHLARLDAAPGN